MSGQEPRERSWSRPPMWDTREFWLGALCSALAIVLGNIVWGVLT